jgi:hypothetical protein
VSGIETFLRGLAERELRRWNSDGRGVPPFSPLSALGRAIATLTQAQAIDERSANLLFWELNVAVAARAGVRPERIRRAAVIRDRGGHPPPVVTGEVSEPLVVPLGQKIQVDNERAPGDLHFMCFVRTEHNAAISTAMRMRWPADGSSTDLEIQGAGPHHLPYRDLSLTDARNARYRVRFRGDGGISDWQGIAQIDPLPPADTGWLDLIADGSHRLARLDLTRAPAPALVSTEQVTALPWERMLNAAAEQIVAVAAIAEVPKIISYLASDIDVLTAAGVITPGSPLPGQVVALCERLGVRDHGIAVAPAPIPAPWAQAIVPAEPTGGPREPAGGPRELAAPLAVSLPAADGTRFAVAGLTTMAGHSTLHVLATGPMAQAGPWFYDQFGCSWWIRDGAGGWHVALARDPDFLADDDVALALTVTPPLTAADGTVQLVVTGASTRVRATVPLRLADN